MARLDLVPELTLQPQSIFITGSRTASEPEKGCSAQLLMPS